MGWQDRDWAKWTDEERARYVGDVGRPSVGMAPGAFLGIVVSLVTVVMLAHPFRPHHATPPPVYGTGVVQTVWGRRTTCTKLELDSGRWTCDIWSMLLAGQQALPAKSLPSGSLCTTAVVDQASGRWICATSS